MTSNAKTGPSRNVQRHDLWLDAKDEINKGVARDEPRRVRRSMARALGNRRYRQGKGLEAKH